MKFIKFIMLASVSTTLSLLCANPVTRNYTFNFDRNTGGWSTPGYWAGKIKFVTGNARRGNGSIEVTTTEKRGQFFARGTIFGITHKYLSGQKISISFYVKGTGEFCAGALLYGRNGKGGETMNFVYGDKVKLTDKWQKVEYIVDLSEKFAERIAPIFELYGKDAVAYIDDAAFTHIRPQSVSISAKSSHVVIPAGSPLPELMFNYSGSNAKINFFAIPANRKQLPVYTSAQSAENGSVTYTGGATFPAGEVAVVAAAEGKQAFCIAEILPAEEFARWDKLAASIKLDKPLNILVLGDSLSDLHRGGNHIDKLVFWLNKHNPGKVTFRNAAINGDFITRVEERLNWKYGKPDVWRLRDYRNIFARKYDLVFIFLGHNDTVASSRDNYATPSNVSLANAEASYRRVIAKIKQKSPNAKIILVSPVASDVTKSRTVAQNMVKWGHAGHIFGLPEHVTPFLAMLQKVAKENGCFYIDLYTPTKNAANRNALFITDGVHLTPEGFRMLSSELLKNLAANPEILK